ncbi:diacylglycerol kinase [Methylomonas rapida]|uniref:Diacylglycerol kinase n=1 Tax=Methylomonas rapida TaxID=2963939 RepID=A0ABY7GK21_9GAMM|nr:diacylglycerol kinase [Methylomonas rapida]WAR43393.1 diacylglycerol kinase [Methylomonas rapida]
MKGQAFNKRLRFALQGLYVAFCREHSVRAHLLAGSGVILVLLMTRPPAIWWAIAILTVGVVLMAELLNAALETLADHLHPEQHPEIGAAKDIAAGAVLIAAIAAAMVAVAFWLR